MAAALVIIPILSHAVYAKHHRSRHHPTRLQADTPAVSLAAAVSKSLAEIPMANTMCKQGWLSVFWDMQGWFCVSDCVFVTDLML